MRDELSITLYILYNVDMRDELSITLYILYNVDMRDELSITLPTLLCRHERRTFYNTTYSIM